MSKRLVIAGAGGFGREILSWVQTSPKLSSELGISDFAFLDDGDLNEALGVPVIGSIASYEPVAEDLVVCGVGDPSARLRIVEALKARGANFTTIVHDSVVRGLDVSVGAGSVVCPHSVLTTNVHLGQHVHVNAQVVIGHDARLQDFVTVSPGSQIMGGAQVEKGAFLGTGALLRPSVSVGEFAVVGMGAVVVKDVRAGLTVFGNPAKSLIRQAAG